MNRPYPHQPSRKYYSSRLPPHPKERGEDQPLYSERDRSAPGRDREPEPSPEGPGQGEWSRPGAKQSHPERPPPTPGRPAGGRRHHTSLLRLHPKTQKRRRRTHEPNGKSEQGKETDHRHASYPSGTSPHHTSACGANQSGETPKHGHVNWPNLSQRQHQW